MADSGYFDGSQFRAIDSEAATDNSPLSAALEGQISNNHQHLHRYGAGSVCRAMGADGTSDQYALNTQTHISVVPAVIFMQPFLVTKGLKRINVNWLGSVISTNPDRGVDVTLELVGFGSVQASWIWPDDANHFDSITLEFESALDVEIMTDLILWGQGQEDETFEVDRHEIHEANGAGGNIYLTPHTGHNCLTTNHWRGIIGYAVSPDPSIASILSYLEPLYRNSDAYIFTGGSTAAREMFITHQPVDISGVQVAEWPYAGLSSRAITIDMEFE